MAVDDRKERESVTTSASPSAFLNEKRIRKMNGTENKLRAAHLLLVPVQLSEFDQSSFLIPKLVRIHG